MPLMQAVTSMVISTFILAALIAIDADSDLAEASEHQLTLSIWSRANGKREVLQIAEQVLALLHDADLTLEDHRLVNLRCERQDIRQLADRRTWRGEMRFRAVTEPGA